MPDTYFAITPDSTCAYELISSGEGYFITTTYTPVLNEDQTQITGFVGSDTPCAASRQIVSLIGNRLAKMSDLSSITPSYIEDENSNKIEADRTFTWREKCSWFVSELNGGTYTYDPPLECAWGTYTIDDGLSQTQTQMWMSKTPYANNEYFGIDANLGFVEYYSKVGDTYVAVTGDMIEEHTENSITMIGLASCSITRTGEWSDHTETLATEEWVGGRDFIQDANENKIYANRTVIIPQASSPSWSITDGTNTYGLTGTKTSANWDNATSKKYSLYMPDTENWTLQYYEMLIPNIWISQWSETVDGTESDTSLTFSQHGFTATWAIPTTTDELATEDWVEDKGYVPYTIDKNGMKDALTIGVRADGSDVGQYSFSVGTLNTASGYNSTTIGYNNTTSTQNAIAFGSSNTVSGNPAVAIGSTNSVTAGGSVAIGEYNDISAGDGVAIGTRNKANAKWTVAMGGKAQANDSGSFVWSGSNKANVALFPTYTSHGKGTFNINPQDGANGFYIGEQTLSGILSGFITPADIITKRDLNDLNIYVDPMADMTTTKFTVVGSYAGDPSTPLFTVELTHSGGEEIRWSWSPSGSNQSISIDYYPNDGSYHLSYLNLQDGGGTEHSG